MYIQLFIIGVLILAICYLTYLGSSSKGFREGARASCLDLISWKGNKYNPQAVCGRNWWPNFTPSSSLAPSCKGSTCTPADCTTSWGKNKAGDPIMACGYCMPGYKWDATQNKCAMPIVPPPPPGPPCTLPQQFPTGVVTGADPGCTAGTPLTAGNQCNVICGNGYSGDGGSYKCSESSCEPIVFKNITIQAGIGSGRWGYVEEGKAVFELKNTINVSKIVFEHTGGQLFCGAEVGDGYGVQQSNTPSNWGCAGVTFRTGKKSQQNTLGLLLTKWCTRENDDAMEPCQKVILPNSNVKGYTIPPPGGPDPFYPQTQKADLLGEGQWYTMDGVNTNSKKMTWQLTNPIMMGGKYLLWYNQIWAWALGSGSGGAPTHLKPIGSSGDPYDFERYNAGLGHGSATYTVTIYPDTTTNSCSIPPLTSPSLTCTKTCSPDICTQSGWKPKSSPGTCLSGGCDISTCCECANGYYLDGTTCKPTCQIYFKNNSTCPSGQYKAIATTHCSSIPCDQSTCCPDNSVCPCPHGTGASDCTSDNKTPKCSSCKKGYNLVGEKCIKDKPVDCQYTWSDWSPCDAPCGGGTQTQTLNISTHPSNDGKACPTPAKKTQECNTGKCGVDCIIGGWSKWTTCSPECGPGNHTRTRTLTPPVADGKKCPPNTTDTQTCNIKACPVDCVMSGWTQWDTCSKDCGTGTQTRTRTAQTPSSGGGKACGETSQSQACNTQPCATDCVMSDWTQWNTCSKPCGKGTQTRTRTATTPASHGGTACGKTSQSQPCNTKACVCICPHGVASIDCTQSGVTKCTKCNKEYHLQGNICKSNPTCSTFHCPSGYTSNASMISCPGQICSYVDCCKATPPPHPVAQREEEVSMFFPNMTYINFNDDKMDDDEGRYGSYQSKEIINDHTNNMLSTLDDSISPFRDILEYTDDTLDYVNSSVRKLPFKDKQYRHILFN